MIGLAIAFIVVLGAHLILRPIVGVAVAKPTPLNSWGDIIVMALGIVTFFGSIVLLVILGVALILSLAGQ